VISISINRLGDSFLWLGMIVYVLGHHDGLSGMSNLEFD
jgi:hypothetical protein